MGEERLFTHYGKIQKALMEGFLAGRPKERIRIENRFSQQQVSAAWQRLIRRGIFNEILEDPNFKDWTWGEYNKAGRVRELVEQGVSRAEIIERTGYSRTEVAHAIGYLR